MNITVLNGSPKGDLSVTMQYIHYIAKKFPQHSFDIINISQPIKRIERDRKVFDEIIAKVKAGDGVIWATPVYYLLVPSQYKRFIELVFERRAGGAFKNKYAAVLITSIHFFDHTARNYLNAICDDLGMKFFGGFNPDMYDLMRGKNRATLEAFAAQFIAAIETRAATVRAFPPLSGKPAAYRPGPAPEPVDPGPLRAVIITDCVNASSNTGKMIARLSAALSGGATVLTIAEMGARAGCSGCCSCGLDNICIHKDDFPRAFDEHVKPADIIVIAGEIKDRYLSSDWKLFFDRSFYNGHAPVLAGKQCGLMVSGPLSQLHGLREIVQAMTEVQGSNLAGFLSDEHPSATIDALIDGLARRLVSLASSGYIQPPSFLGLGGRKIFRDDVWGRLRFVFQKDHRYYMNNGWYDFPQKDYKTRRLNALMMFLTKLPPLRKEIQKRIPAEMVKPLQHVVKNK